MSTSGSSAILVALGTATLAPVWLRWAASRLPVSRLGVGGYLAGGNSRRRAHLLSAVLAPVTILVATAISVLMLSGIDGRTNTGTNPDAEMITLLNYITTGMITLFASIMVINGVTAMLAHRRTEFVRLRQVGATPSQIRGSVLAEALIVSAVGVLLGALASLATIIPFAYARDEGMVPDGQLWLPPLVAICAATITLIATRAGVRRLPHTVTA